MDEVAATSAAAPADELERYRDYLRFLADVKLDRRIRNRIDPSDIVQETMLKACAAWRQCRGDESGQRVAWLRQILLRTVLHALRDARRAKRDWARERQFADLLDRSSLQIESWLAADATSPSLAAQQAEQLLQVAGAVSRLPEAERIAVTGFYWQGATLAELSETLGRTPPAVAGLLYRGLKRLQSRLATADPS